MNIRKIWDKFLAGIVVGEPEPELEPVPLEVLEALVTPLPDIQRKELTPAQRELSECFYGTLVAREPGGVRTHRKRHLHDGWRSGVSHPFTFGDQVYDVQPTTDLSRKLFDELMEELGGG